MNFLDSLPHSEERWAHFVTEDVYDVMFNVEVLRRGGLFAMLPQPEMSIRRVTSCPWSMCVCKGKDNFLILKSTGKSTAPTRVSFGIDDADGLSRQRTEQLDCSPSSTQFASTPKAKRKCRLSNKRRTAAKRQAEQNPEEDNNVSAVVGNAVELDCSPSSTQFASTPKAKRKCRLSNKRRAAAKRQAEQNPEEDNNVSAVVGNAVEQKSIRNDCNARPARDVSLSPNDSDFKSSWQVPTATIFEPCEQ